MVGVEPMKILTEQAGGTISGWRGFGKGVEEMGGAGIGNGRTVVGSPPTLTHTHRLEAVPAL